MSDEFGHVGQIIPGFGCIDSWGVGPFVITAENGKTYRFEDSDRFGPALVKEDGDPLKNPWPRERDPFWRAHMLWRKQGRRLEPDGFTCIWHEPKPHTFYRIDRRNVMLVEGGDEDGKYVEVPRPHQENTP